MRVGPIPMTAILTRRGKFGHGHIGRTPDDGGAEIKAASTSQGMPMTSGNHSTLRTRHGIVFLQSL